MGIVEGPPRRIDRARCVSNQRCWRSRRLTDVAGSSAARSGETRTPLMTGCRTRSLSVDAFPTVKRRRARHQQDPALRAVGDPWFSRPTPRSSLRQRRVVGLGVEHLTERQRRALAGRSAPTNATMRCLSPSRTPNGGAVPPAVVGSGPAGLASTSSTRYRPARSRRSPPRTHADAVARPIPQPIFTPVSQATAAPRPSTGSSTYTDTSSGLPQRQRLAMDALLGRWLDPRPNVWLHLWFDESRTKFV